MRVSGPNGQSAVHQTGTGTTLQVVQPQNANTTSAGTAAVQDLALVLIIIAAVIVLRGVVKGLSPQASTGDHFVALALLALVVIWADKSQMIQQAAQAGSYLVAGFSSLTKGGTTT